MLRVFNKKWTRRLEAAGDPKDFIILKPYAFADIPERYTQDITFKMGVKAGDIEVIETKSRQAVLESTPEAPEEVAEKPAKKGRAKKTAESE